MATKDLRINRQIRAREVFVIDAEGNQRGIMSSFDAMALAESVGLTWWRYPRTPTPGLQNLDFGKYRYEQEKRMRDAKRNQNIVKMKEIRMQPKIEKHDLETKSKFIGEFLGEGNKVKVSIRFRGRELAHTELGKVVLDRILAQLELNGVGYNLDREAAMEGRMMSMIVSPSKSAPKKENQ